MKKEKGYCCDLCEKLICKYQLDLNNQCIWMDNDKLVCDDCAYKIGKAILDRF